MNSESHCPGAPGRTIGPPAARYLFMRIASYRHPGVRVMPRFRASLRHALGVPGRQRKEYNKEHNIEKRVGGALDLVDAGVVVQAATADETPQAKRAEPVPA